MKKFTTIAGALLLSTAIFTAKAATLEYGVDFTPTAENSTYEFPDNPVTGDFKITIVNGNADELFDDGTILFLEIDYGFMTTKGSGAKDGSTFTYTAYEEDLSIVYLPDNPGITYKVTKADEDEGEDDGDDTPRYTYGADVTMGPNLSSIIFYVAESDEEEPEETPLCLVSNSKVNLLEYIKSEKYVEIPGLDPFTSTWNYKAVLMENGYYAYNCITDDEELNMFSPGTSFPIEYLGADEVTFTISKTPAEGEEEGDNIELMEDAAVGNYVLATDDPSSAVELSWGDWLLFAEPEGEPAPQIRVETPSGLSMVLDKTYVHLGYEGDEPGVGFDADDTDDADQPETGNVLLISLEAFGQEPELGVYNVTIPQGLVANYDGAVNPEQEIQVKIIATYPEGTLTPENATFAAGEDVVLYISFEDADLVVESKSGDDPVLVSNYNDYDETFSWSELVSINEDNQIVIKLGNELAGGLYYVTLRPGAVLVDDAPNALVEATFTVEGSAVEAIIPTTVGELQQGGVYTTQTLPSSATITWDYEELILTGDGTITIEYYNEEGELKQIDVDKEDVKLASVTPPTDDQTPGVAADETEGEEGEEEVNNVLFIDNLDTYLEALEGNINLVIPEGFVTVNGEVGEGYQIDFVITPVFGLSPEFLLNEEEGTVDVTWPGYGAYVSRVYDLAPYVTSVNVEEPETFVPEVDDLVGQLEGEMANPVGISVDLGALELKDGEYVLYIPLGYVTIVNDDLSVAWVNAEATWTFEVEDGEIVPTSSAINAIESANGVVEGVYNLQGVKMSNDLNTLAKGLYIINGKKVLVK